MANALSPRGWRGDRGRWGDRGGQKLAKNNSEAADIHLSDNYSQTQPRKLQLPGSLAPLNPSPAAAPPAGSERVTPAPRAASSSSPAGHRQPAHRASNNFTLAVCPRRNSLQELLKRTSPPPHTPRTRRILPACACARRPAATGWTCLIPRAPGWCGAGRTRPALGTVKSVAWLTYRQRRSGGEEPPRRS